MIQPTHTVYAVTCDACTEDDEVWATDRNGAVHEMRRQGWKMKNVAGEQLHTCPECSRPDVGIRDRS